MLYNIFMIIKIVHFLLSQKKKNDLPSQAGRLHKVQDMDNYEKVLNTLTKYHPLW